MSTMKFCLMCICVACLVLFGLVCDFFFNPRQFFRDMREANEAEQ